MYLFNFLLITILFLDIVCTVFADDTGKICPYYGKKDPRVLKKLKSRKFRNSLSPFARYYLDSMPSENYFFKLFDTSFKPDAVYKAFFLKCVDWLAQSSDKCPIELCKKVAKQIDRVFKNISPLDYFLVIASNLENSMKEAGKMSNRAATRKEIRACVLDVAGPLCSSKVRTPIEAIGALDEGSTVTFKRWGTDNPKFIEYVESKQGEFFAKYGETPVPLD